MLYSFSVPKLQVIYDTWYAKIAQFSAHFVSNIRKPYKTVKKNAA